MAPREGKGKGRYARLQGLGKDGCGGTRRVTWLAPIDGDGRCWWRKLAKPDPDPVQELNRSQYTM